MNETVEVSMMIISAKTKRDMKIVVTIEARMTSTRLPGKGLKTIVGRPVLELLIERLQRSEIKCGKPLILLETVKLSHLRRLPCVNSIKSEI